jgi:CBS domain-containing protein
MPAGYFDAQLEELEAEHAAEAHSVHHVMQEEVLACPADSTVPYALELMFEHRAAILPVVDDDGRVVGILTSRDLARAMHRGRFSSETTRASEVATTPVHVVLPSDPLGLAVVRMREHGVRRLPVVDEDRKLVGLVSIEDVARVAASGPARDAFAVAEALARMSARAR